MSRHYYYYIHRTENPNSKIISEGKAQDIAVDFGISPHRVGDVFLHGNRLLSGKHFMERKFINENDAAYKKKDKKFKDELEVIERMLRMHGNTIAYHRIERIVKALEKDGYFVNVKHEEKRVIKYHGGGKDVYRECWIIELDHREEKENK